VEDVIPRIKEYRQARQANGFDPDAGTVTLMLHTFVGKSDEAVREVIRAPFLNYLASSVDLWQSKWSDLQGPAQQRMLTYAFERYFRTSALFGSVQRCVEFARRLRDAGVNELACLVDFGAPAEQTLGSLDYLNELRLRLLTDG
jgi:alkanesulfonate monooxygenase SsuD/methylene tetrahydromethanopterin reductase-like flavin-dependent oxidoreductase (luciferase family)